ncbi:MAG: helix-turn-helix domain-containing protein [Bacteroidota bacterium]
MEKIIKQTLDFESFVSRFMGDHNGAFVRPNDPIQIYPLSIAQSLIQPPTPLFRAEYSFLLIFLNGGGEQQIDTDTYELQPNDLLFIREGHLNAIHAIDPDTEGFYIHLDYTLLPLVFDNEVILNSITFNPKHAVTTEKMAQLLTCCELIQQQRNSSHALKTTNALLKALFLMITEDWPSTHEKSDRMSEISLRFKQALFDNFRVSREVSFYAEKLAVSQNYLNRCVTATTSKPPKQHINEMVINHSKLMLQNPAYTISQVAYQLNFKAPSHFGRLFKKLTGQTPTSYLKAISQQMS